MKRILGCSLAIALLAAAPASQSARAFGYELWYFDDNGGLVGTYTVPPCGGPPILEGIVTNNFVASWEAACNG